MEYQDNRNWQVQFAEQSPVRSATKILRELLLTYSAYLLLTLKK